MLSLLGDRFAPITWSIGFLEASIDAVSTALTAWRERLYGACEVRDLAFPDSLGQLEPLTTAARPRELLVEAGTWTAYFDCSLRGTDAEPVIGHLSQTMGCTEV